MTMNDVCYMSALELRKHYQSHELSPIEVTGVILERIGQLNPKMNAFLTVTSERALEDARRAERAYMSNEPTAPLAGIPISIKDLTLTKGIRTTRGSLLFQDSIPEEDSPFVERVYAAGAVMLGKTNTPEFGWKANSSNRLIEPTQNPWKYGHTAGGSSGGAAAAVAAGMGPLAQGTDGAGSIRIPAAFCGVFGHKPSYGLIPYAPASAVEGLAHMGPITRTVRDAALLMNVSAGPDARDRSSFASDVDYLAACEGGIEGLRIAWSPNLGYAECDPEVLEICTKAVQKFSELGCHVEQVDANLSDPWEVIDVIWSVAQAGTHKDNFNEIRDLIDPGRIPLIEHGQELRAVDLYMAFVQRTAWYEAMRRFIEPYDLLITPQMSVTAFDANIDQPAELNGRLTTYLNWTPYTYPFNVTGQPAASVPCGFAANGLPVALQIVGHWRDDATVLRAAAAWEAHSPWAQHRPPVG